MPSPFPVLSCEGLSAGYGAREVFSGVSASFPPGSVTVVSGPNGAGKSTLLSVLARAARPRAGRVLLGERPAETIPRRAFARSVAFVPQAPDAASLAGVSVRDVAASGRIPRSGLFAGASPEDERAIRAALADAGLADFAARDAGKLSGGETRRVFLAAALAQELRRWHSRIES